MTVAAVVVGYCLSGALIGGAVTYRLNLHRQPRFERNQYASQDYLRAGAMTAAIGAGVLWPVAIFVLLAITIAFGLEWWATSKERRTVIERAVDKAMAEAQEARDRRIGALERELGLREESTA